MCALSPRWRNGHLTFLAWRIGAGFMQGGDVMLSAVASLLTAPAPALVTEDACRATSSSDDGGVTVLVLGSERAFPAVT